MWIGHRDIIDSRLNDFETNLDVGDSRDIARERLPKKFDNRC